MLHPGDIRPRDAISREVSVGKLGWAAFAFIIFVTIAQSKIVWFDFRTLASQAGTEFELFRSLVYWSLALLPFVAYFILRHMLDYLRDPFVYLLLALNVFWAVFGLLIGNDPVVIAQDVWKYAFPAVGYIAACATFNRWGFERPMQWLFFITLGAMVFRYGYFALERGSLLGLRYGGVLELYSIAFTTAMIVHHKGGKQLAYLLLLLFCLGLIVVGEKRTTVLIASAIILLGYFLLAVRGRIGGTFIAMSLVGLAAVLYLFLGDTNLNQTFDALRKLRPEELLDVSGEMRRKIEIEVIFRTLNDHPLAYFFGFGSGSEFQLPTFFEKTLQEMLHSVHFTPAAMLYRHGIFGLYIFGFIAFYGMRWRPLGHPGPLDPFVLTATFYKIAAFISSFIIYGLVDDFLVGICTALLIASLRMPRHPSGGTLAHA